MWLFSQVLCKNNRMDKVYTEICVEELANVLAIEAWKEDTKNCRDDDLWEVTAMLDPNGNSAEIVKTVRSYWQTTFWALKSGYEDLIMSYSKTTEHDNQTTSKEGP